MSRSSSRKGVFKFFARIRSWPLAVLALSLGCSSADPVVTPPTVAPTPAPAATASPVASGCPLPSLPDLRNTCPKLTPQLWEYVENAIQRTVREHPEFFDLSDDLGGGAYRVLDRDRYIKSVVANVQAQGLCSREEIEEIQVKNTNEFHEQYNIWVSSGHVRHGPRAYITTCFPAQF
jgi:hypothetical protein